MAPPTAFSGYPVPEEGPDVECKFNVENLPVLRGMPLLLGGNLVARVGALQRFFWGNAGFGTIKDMPELDDMPLRFHPLVTPLGETGPMLPFESELTQTKLLSATSSSPTAPKYYSAADYHELYKTGKLTPLQVAETLLGVINDVGGKYSNAWAPTHGKDSLALEAARASTERYASGTSLGILDGVPIGVKDDIDVKGYICHRGMKYNPNVPFFKESKETLWPVQKLQEAGAVVISKNAMHELGSDTSGLNVAQGTPTNHCNPSYYPGGSTSGGASALGAGVVPIVVGTDAGGSTRIPASFNGVYGMKTTHQRISSHKLTMAVVSPLAASATDLTIAYRLMSQTNPDDGIARAFARSVPPSPGDKKVVGVFKEWWGGADDRVREACEKAVSYLKEKCGYEVVDISIPLIAEARTAHALLCVAEMHEKARRQHPEDWLSVVGPANKLLLTVASQTPAADYLKANALRELMMRHLAFLFQKHPGLLILTPTSPLVGWARHPSDDSYGCSDTNITIKNMMYIFLSNMCGTPSLSAPIGFTDPDQGEGKLSIGMLAMGEWGAEEQLLSWAREMEVYLHEGVEGGRVRPKTWFDIVAEVGKSQGKGAE